VLRGRLHSPGVYGEMCMVLCTVCACVLHILQQRLGATAKAASSQPICGRVAVHDCSAHCNFNACSSAQSVLYTVLNVEQGGWLDKPGVPTSAVAMRFLLVKAQLSPHSVLVMWLVAATPSCRGVGKPRWDPGPGFVSPGGANRPGHGQHTDGCVKGGVVHDALVEGVILPGAQLRTGQGSLGGQLLGNDVTLGARDGLCICWCRLLQVAGVLLMSGRHMTTRWGVICSPGGGEAGGQVTGQA